VAYPDRLTDCSDCLLLLSADTVITLEHSVDTVKSVSLPIPEIIAST